MINAIRNFFDNKLSANESTDPEEIEHQLRLATAALFIEMMYQDDKVHAVEVATVKSLLKSKFELSDEETLALFDLARQELGDATDFYQFTNLIARNYTEQQKIRVIEYLWMIAYADGHLDTYEEHMVRRIADLIYVSHKDFIRTKHKAQETD